MSTTLPQETSSSAPRRRITLWHISVILVIVGLFISAYLSYTHFSDQNVACVGGEDSAFNCDLVNSNPRYAMFLGIYVGYLGLAGDVLLLLILLVAPRIKALANYEVLAVFAVTLLGWLFHGYLTYASVAIIQHLCIWCLAHHAVMTLLLIVTSIRLYRTLFSGEPDVA